MGHQPTTHATRAHLPFPSSLSFPRAQTGPTPPAQPTAANRRDASLPFHPGQLTGGTHPSAFPFLSPATPGSRSLAPAASPRLATSAVTAAPSSARAFSSFFPAVAPAPSRHLTAARACPRSTTAQRNRPPARASFPPRLGRPRCQALTLAALAPCHDAATRPDADAQKPGAAHKNPCRTPKP
jgi:hypothetical protein